MKESPVLFPARPTKLHFSLILRSIIAARRVVPHFYDPER